MSDTDHSEEWGDQPTIKFFPDHIMSEMTAVILLLTLYTIMAIFFSAELDVKANPAVTPVGIKPEWYFLFLFAFLHYVSPLIGTIIPVVLLGLLIALPWLDRNPERALGKRKIFLVIVALTIAALFYMTYIGAVAE